MIEETQDSDGHFLWLMARNEARAFPPEETAYRQSSAATAFASLPPSLPSALQGPCHTQATSLKREHPYQLHSNS